MGTALEFRLLDNDYILKSRGGVCITLIWIILVYF